METKLNYFEVLNNINCNDKVEEKNGLTYLSWAYAWGELKKLYPHSYYTVYEDGLGMNYFNDGKTAWVKTGVTVVIDENTKIEHIEYLPVMDFRNKSIKLAEITSFDVNKTIQRSLTKAVARHGLGLYIYAGEDLPENEKPKEEKPTSNKPTEETLAKAKEIGLKLEGVATYFKKKVEDLTEEEVKACLERKIQAMKKKENKNGTN